MRSGSGPRDVRADLTLGEGQPVEAICPSGGGWGWTREARRASRSSGTVEIRGASGRSKRLGSTTSRPATTSATPAGSGQRGWAARPTAAPVAWNLVTGINDPPRNSERGIWVDGEPHEPEPVVFEGLGGVAFAGGEQMAFESEAERARDENLILFRSRYRHQFGTFAGSLDGIDLAWGLGVMEEHEARW